MWYVEGMDDVEIGISMSSSSQSIRRVISVGKVGLVVATGFLKPYTTCQASPNRMNVLAQVCAYLNSDLRLI